MSTMDKGLPASNRHFGGWRYPRVVEVHPYAHSFGNQNAWVLDKSIWNIESKDSNSKPRAETQYAYPHQNNKLDAAHVSRSIATISTTGDNKTSMITNSGAPFYPSPPQVTKFDIQKGTMASSIGLRSVGNPSASPSSTSTMDGIGRSSLYKGSKPDMSPSGYTNNRPTLNNRQSPKVGREFQQSNLEDVEEFVPSYLQNDGIRQNQMAKAGTQNTSDLQNGFSGGNLTDFHDRYGPFSMRSEAISNNANPRSGLSYHTVRDFHAADELLESETHRLGMQANSRSNVYHNTDDSDDVRAPVRSRHESTFNDIVSLDRKFSGLRADVAAYQPSHSDAGAQFRPRYQKGAGHAHRSDVSFNPRSIDMYPPSVNQRSGSSNHDAFGNNSLVNPAVTRGDQYHTGQLQSPASYYTHPGVPDPRYGNTNDGLSYQSHGHVVPASGRSTAPGTNNAALYTGSSAQASYGNLPHEYVSDARMTHHEQAYGFDPVMSVSNHHDGYVPEINSKETRSEILEEFRTYYKSRKYELKDIYGHIVEFSGDQTGSRFIQTKLEQANSDEKEQIFSELQTDARQLMTDVFGNYVIQKMFEYGNQSQKKMLASQMQGYVMRLSSHAYGCRCVQKAFEHILTDQQASLVKELKDNVLSVVESQHGNHVIQKAIECIPGEHIQFIVDAHKHHVVRLSQNIYGCRIIQRMLEHCVPAAKRGILDELHVAIPLLIDDQYGNYVIQCIIKKCPPTDRQRVIKYVQERQLYYSTHKFASNVVEKAIQYADEDQREDMIRVLTSPDFVNGRPSPVLELLKDQYGNYVIQTVLRTIQGPAKQALAEEVRRHLICIGRVSRSKQVTAMADTLASITAGHSPSSVSTGPQTPRTPMSLHPGCNIDPSMTKAFEMVPGGFSTREPHCD